MAIIWRDVYFFGNVFNIFYLISLIYALMVIVQNPNVAFFTNLTFFTYIFYILILFFTFNSFRMKLSYITNEGIRIGNTPDNYYMLKIKLKQKPQFFRWNEVEYLKIIGRVVNQFGYINNILILKSKSGKKYECWITKPKKFINKLSEINKRNLLRKDSKLRIFQELRKI